jgi:hypothetical protein
MRWVAVAAALLTAPQDRNLLDNASFEAADGEVPRGWSCIVTPAHRRAVEFAFDEKEPKDGARSVRVKNPEPANVAANSFTQRLDGNTAADLRSKWVELTGFVKGRNAVMADLWIQCFDDADRELARHRCRRYGGLWGTFDWTAASARGEIPKKTRSVLVRCVLTGTGEAWFDGMKLKEIKPPKPADVVKVAGDDAERRDALSKFVGGGDKPAAMDFESATKALAAGLGPAPWASGYKRFAFHAREREWSYEVWIPEEAKRGGAWPLLVDPGHPKGADDHKNWVGHVGARDLFVLRSNVLEETEKLDGFQQLPVHGKDAFVAGVMAAMMRDVRLRLPVDPNRVYWTGLSMTAYTDWSFGVRHPDLIAAAAPFSGAPRNYAGLVANLAGQGWYVVHGDADTICPVKWTRAAVDALKTAGVDHVYRELPGLGHGDVIVDRGNALEWMSARVRDPYPRKVTLKLVEDVTAWWITAKAGAAKAPAWSEERGFEATGEVAAEIKDNVITVRSEGVAQLRIWLNGKLVDFAKPVKLVLNGRESERTLTASMDVLLERLKMTADAGALYDAVWDVDVTK